ncbi:prepilin-type N-terminal cleavage/methylation domain-containing protein [Pseudoduganella ginsengisoli]|uniref:Prepilin-type N-terminal cleavage/methylation domain-containing protein n=1 Tax=Pseudoduganella ginsengisoli TaxID=1462440 RepID=A0A6L6Q8S3_9BURK|nr:prepilin-type N-terminal cleavage/methylation domain-containing protein [Pseudoduganella ginsengisoli]MTW05826.1 prepilin-type N-terminal cleavage/methylation domain-containing protein [Pseudoduganella ginsengisoli]
MTFLHSAARRRGFTLVEIAIVLVIIGLLLGGVLKGQGLIDSAKVKNIIQQSNSLTAAVNAYQDKFRALPGDDPLATTHVPGATGNGNGDGQISEYYLAPQHLALGGFITGSYNGSTDFMTSAQGGAVYLYNDVVGGRGGNGIRFDNLPDTFAEQIDSKLDDGKPNTGSVRANTAGGAYTSSGAIVPRTAIFF